MAGEKTQVFLTWATAASFNASLCENATLAAVAALKINDLTVLRTGFSHRLTPG